MFKQHFVQKKKPEYTHIFRLLKYYKRHVSLFGTLNRSGQVVIEKNLFEWNMKNVWNYFQKNFRKRGFVVGVSSQWFKKEKVSPGRTLSTSYMMRFNKNVCK